MNALQTTPIAYDISTANLRLFANFARANKCGTIEEYRKQINKGREHYSTERVKVTHVVNLTKRAYDVFTQNLLDDVEWLTGIGGHESDMDQPAGEFFDWTEEQQEEFRRTSYRLVIAVVCEERATIYVDPQGYTYARYVGI